VTFKAKKNPKMPFSYRMKGVLHRGHVQPPQSWRFLVAVIG
jgi:hypothetical protein